MLCYSTDSHRHAELLISFHVICGSNTFRGVLQGTLPRETPAARSRRRRCASADAVRSAPASAVAPPRRITGGPNTPGMSGDGDAGWFDGSRCRSGVGDPRGAPRGGGMGSRRRGSARPVAAIYMAATASRAASRRRWIPYASISDLPSRDGWRKVRGCPWAAQAPIRGGQQEGEKSNDLRPHRRGLIIVILR